MPYARIDAKENKKVLLKVFSGLDRRDKISNSSLTEMTNMSARAIPALVPREERRLIISTPNATEICSPEYTGGRLNSFTGVMDNHFYYKSIKIEGTLAEGRKSIADFNGKICIFPDKMYYDYNPNPVTGEIENKLVSMEKTVSGSSCTFYSVKNSATEQITSYIYSPDIDFESVFSIGDSIVISDCNTEYNNTKIVKSRMDHATPDDIVSVTVKAFENKKIYLDLYNKKGERVAFKNVTEPNAIKLKLAIPDMDNICVHNNRLWGTAASGEYIYASKLGDCTNFYSFQGLSDDSWYSPVGTSGKFTGICSYRTAVVAFKRGCIHHIYGDSPVNFSIPKQTFGGCIDGKSICEIGGVLYYLSSDGFCAYSGGEPYNISACLNTKYKSCVSGCNGKNYYASAKREDGKTDVLVYTPETNIWVREDDTPFCSFCSYNGSIYGIANDIMWQLDGGSEPFRWCVVSKRLTYDTIEHKGLSCIWLRMELDDNTEVNISVSMDGKEFKNCGTIHGGNGFSVYRVPIRFGKCDSFRIMLDGEGVAVIHDIEITSHNGGRVYG